MAHPGKTMRVCATYSGDFHVIVIPHNYKRARTYHPSARNVARLNQALRRAVWAGAWTMEPLYGPHMGYFADRH